MYGGQLPKAQNSMNLDYINAYTDAAKALGLSNQEIAQQIKNQKFAFNPQGQLTSDNMLGNQGTNKVSRLADKMAYDEMINSMPGLFNPKGLTEEELTIEAIQDAVLKENAERIAQEEMLRQMELSQGMPAETREQRIKRAIQNSVQGYKVPEMHGGRSRYELGGQLPKHQSKGYIDNTKVNTKPVIDPYAQYIQQQTEAYKKQYNEDFNPMNFNSTPGTDSTIYKQGNKQFNLLTRTGFEKQQSMKTPTVATKADGGYPDSTTNRSGFTNEYYGDQYRGKSYDYRDGQSPKAANAHMPRGMMSDRFNPLMGNNVDPYSAFGEQGDSRGQNGKEAPYNKYKPQMEKGGMIGKTIQYKKVGQVKTGKIIGISKTGKYIVK
jgi:hypothetical protein